MDRNTIVILSADNGYFLGERGYAGKWTMHERSIRVPLILHDPRRTEAGQGAVLKEMALNVDIPPTMLDLAGVSVPEAMQGRSLLPWLRDRRGGARRTEVFCEHLWDHEKIPQTEAIHTERWKYIRYPRHPEYEELYDLSADPREEMNLASLERFRDVLLDLRARCDRAIRNLEQGRNPFRSGA